MSREFSVDDVLAPSPSLTRMVFRALRLHCPRCGAADQFHHWVRRRDHCPACGYSMEHRPDFFFGAYLVNLFITLLSMFGLMIFVVCCEAARVRPPLTAVGIAGLLVAFVLPVFLYPFTFTIWAVVDLRSEPLELQEIAEALDKLDADRSDETNPAEHQPC